jgi:hypothetical protein
MSNVNYTTYNNFETGAIGHFDATDDDNSALSYAHYTELARTPGLAMPYRGAYCLRIDLATATTDGAWLQETDSWDMTAGSEDIYLRLKFWLSSDTAMSSDDTFNLIEFWSSTNTIEAVAGVKYTTASGWEIGVGAAAPTVLSGLSLGQWHDLEVYFNPAGGAGGTLDWWLDGTSMTQLASLTNANITSGIIGAKTQDATPTTTATPTAGTLLIDQVIGSQTDNTSTRIGSGGMRFPKTVLLEAAPSGTTGHHVFIGYHQWHHET